VIIKNNLLKLKNLIAAALKQVEKSKQKMPEINSRKKGVSHR